MNMKEAKLREDKVLQKDYNAAIKNRNGHLDHEKVNKGKLNESSWSKPVSKLNRGGFL